jgi:hypothetical protein
MQPERGPARVGRGGPIDGIVGRRHQQRDPEYERRAETQATVIEKALASFAHETRPDKKTGEYEHQVHQVDVLKRAEKVEAEPPLAINDRICHPTIGGGH